MENQNEVEVNDLELEEEEVMTIEEDDVQQEEDVKSSNVKVTMTKESELVEGVDVTLTDPEVDDKENRIEQDKIKNEEEEIDVKNIKDEEEDLSRLNNNNCDNLYVRPRPAINRGYRNLRGMLVHEMVQRMIQRGRVLWVGKELKYVGTDQKFEDDDEENEGFGDSELLRDGEDEEQDSEGLTQSSRLRKRGHKVATPRGYFVEPKENARRRIRQLRAKLKEQYEQQEDEAHQWDCIEGNDDSAMAARKRMHQIWFQRQLKKLSKRDKVDPSSIVPVSVSGSTASSASSGSETDPECIATDEEDETELITGSLEGWIVPQQEVASRSPSPIGIAAEPEFELEEPEFILTEPPAEEPPTKKRKQKHEPQPHTDGKIYPKPAFSYSCLIAMALKNSKTGCLPVSEIYKFMCDHFPYFKSAPSGWKNSVRHNLSLNKCFEKIEKPGTGARKGCLWALNPAKVTKMEEEVQKWSRKDPVAIRRAMSDPENLELIEKGELKRDYSGNAGSDEDEEEDFSEPVTPSTPNLLQVRRPRPSSSESLISMVDSRVTSTTPSSVSQIRTNLLRPVDHKLHLKDDSLDFGTITNVQGNYLCHSSNGTNTYTLSFSSLHNSPAPLIIRRTPVK